MKLVIIESPYAGDVDANVKYAQLCVRDSLSRGEAPIASHLLYTQPNILDDNILSERQKGIDAGLAWQDVSDGTVVYTDLGISSGMKYGIKAAEDAGKNIEYRKIINFKEKTMTFEDKIIRLLAENLDCDVKKNMHLEDDLGADSLDRIEIIMALEEELSVEIPDDLADTWKTVDDVIRGLKKKLDEET